MTVMKDLIRWVPFKGSVAKQAGWVVRKLPSPCDSRLPTTTASRHSCWSRMHISCLSGLPTNRSHHCSPVRSLIFYWIRSMSLCCLFTCQRVPTSVIDCCDLGEPGNAFLLTQKEKTMWTMSWMKSHHLSVVGVTAQRNGDR